MRRLLLIGGMAVWLLSCGNDTPDGVNPALAPSEETENGPGTATGPGTGAAPAGGAATGTDAGTGGAGTNADSTRRNQR